jgi:hypothetical protein
MDSQEFITFKKVRRQRFSISLNLTDKLTIGELELVFISLLFLSLLIVII